jgi:UDP-N-acetyl-D-glucosamine dehydrogenase
LTSQNINSADIVVLLTDHDDFDYNLIEKNSRLLVDTRGKFIKNKNKNLFKA